METYELESECLDTQKEDLGSQKVIEELDAIQKLLNASDVRLNKDFFPLLTQKLNFFFHQNHQLLKNTIIHNFLQNDEHLILLICSLYNLKEYKTKLDQKFREFYFEYRYVAYMSKVLYYKSIQFDRS